MSVHSGPADWWTDTTDGGRIHMATKGIEQNGLVLNVDFGASTSYSGSGTRVNNLSSATSTGTLVNGPTFSNIFLTFDGTNDHVDFGTNALGLGASNKTMCAWIYPTGYSDPNLVGIVDQDKDGVGGYGFWLSTAGKLWYWPAGFQDITDNGPLSAGLNTWTYVSIAYNFSAKSGSFYYNGNLSSTRVHGGTESAPDATTKLIIGSVRNAAAAFFTGRISMVSLYNRTLTQTEIQKNFNSTRGRFGI